MPSNEMNTDSTKKAFSWRVGILLFLGIGLLVAGLSVFLQARSQTVQGFLDGDPKSADTVGFGSSFELPGQPARLVIPAIGVNAAVQSVGLAANGDMGIPTNFTDTAWYNGGPRPGMPGSAVIDGHLDGRNVPQAVFYNIDKLKAGDLVEVVDEKGKTLQFRVIETKIYDYDAPTTEVFSGDASKARLNLITCAGSWLKTEKLYDKRVVVFTELVTDN